MRVFRSGVDSGEVPQWYWLRGLHDALVLGVDTQEFAYDVTQAELLSSLAQMYNLRIYSHEPSRRVYVEPYDEFYQSDEVDWSEKLLIFSR